MYPNVPAVARMWRILTVGASTSALRVLRMTGYPARYVALFERSRVRTLAS
jgi:hypothetical protein